MQPEFFSYKKVIDGFLSAFLQSRRDDLSAVNTWGGDMTDRLTDFAVAGKTIRGSLLLFAAQIYGVPDLRGLYPAAAAVELLHSGLLIHDDIMDRDEARRGKPSVYKQYADREPGVPPKSSGSFGQDMAICAGDAAFFLGWECLSQTPEHYFRSLAPLFAREFSFVCAAQMQDVFFGISRDIPPAGDVRSLYMYKTGRYTFSLPLCAGALVGNADSQEISLLTELGITAGVLFQIHDDELNLYGNPDETGKPVGSDVRESKKTIYLSTLFDMASPSHKKEIMSDLQQVKVSAQSGARIYELLSEYRVREVLGKEMNDLVSQSDAVIGKLKIGEKEKKSLKTLISFVRTRNR